MNFRPALWQPIAIGLSAINLVAVGFAAAAAEPAHAAIHSGVALAFGLWAQRMGQRRAVGGGEVEVQDRLEGLEGEMTDLKGQLSEVQERLDFTERVLAQNAEARRLGPDR
jgi:hypothetical protein